MQRFIFVINFYRENCYNKDLISLERKYSDSLSEEDLNGFMMEVPKTKKKVKTNNFNILVLYINNC